MWGKNHLMTWISPGGSVTPYEKLRNEAPPRAVEFGTKALYSPPAATRESVVALTFSPRGKVGCVISYARIGALQVLDWEHRVDSGGKVRVVTTRDVRAIEGEYCWADHKLYDSTLGRARQYQVVEKVPTGFSIFRTVERWLTFSMTGPGSAGSARNTTLWLWWTAGLALDPAVQILF